MFAAVLAITEENMVSAIIAAGGRGRRMGADINKVYLSLRGKEILAHTLSVFQRCKVIDEIVVVTGPDDIEKCCEIIARDGITKAAAVVEGGAERSDSVYTGLSAASGELAVIHDGARCLVTDEEICAVIEDAEKYGAAAVGVPVKDTLKTIDVSGRIMGTVDRERTVQIQTPQVFKREEIAELHRRIKAEGVSVTDDCSVFERYGREVHFTMGSYENIKLTTPADITAAERIIDMRKK